MRTLALKVHPKPFDERRTRPSSSPNKTRKKDNTQAGCLILTMLGTGILGVINADISFFIIALGLGMGIAYWDSIKHQMGNSRFLLQIAVVGCLTAFFLMNFGGTANAAWLDNVESWMTGAFPTSTDIASLVFNVIRAAYVIYLAVSGVLVFVALKRQEGFFEAAQLPLASLLIVGVVDAIAGFIIA